MIVFVLKIIPHPDKRRELLDILHTVTGPTSIQQGCLTCEIYEGLEDINTILYLEQWDCSTSLHQHIKSNLFVRLLAAMELSSKQPVIVFYEVSQIFGMELIETIRIPEKLM